MRSRRPERREVFLPRGLFLRTRRLERLNWRRAALRAARRFERFDLYSFHRARRRARPTLFQLIINVLLFSNYRRTSAIRICKRCSERLNRCPCSKESINVRCSYGRRRMVEQNSSNLIFAKLLKDLSNL